MFLTAVTQFRIYSHIYEVCWSLTLESFYFTPYLYDYLPFNIFISLLEGHESP